ncbi:MAG: primosomal protein N' [Phycisphaerae bacterium]
MPPDAPVPDKPTHSRDRQLLLLAREGRLRREQVALVAVAARVPDLRVYSVPDALAGQVAVGVSVRVPFGSRARLVDGVCARVDEREWELTRPAIAEVLPSTPRIDSRLVELGLWISEYYACPPGVALAALTPSIVRRSGAASARRRKARAPAMTQPPASDVSPEEALVLTAAQQAACQAISAAGDSFGVYVLFGLPGSGKTEVYVRSIRAIIARGRQAILLAPEIALATQIVDRLSRRFERVCVLHSRLTPAQRRAAHEAIAAGGVDVVIGTRSAVFAPCPRLGLLVVDEEQESSYKNLATPYFHTRDAAIKRAQLESIPVVLGSATPSLETWHNAHTLPHYRLLELRERVPGARLPETRAVCFPRREGAYQSANLRAEPLQAEPTKSMLLSPDLEDALRGTLSVGGQAILLFNRRGYARSLRCTRCGLAIRCVRCGAAMIDHRPAAMHCHRCGLREPLPRACLDSTCGGELERGGMAIQRLEEELERLLPQARLLRLDRDTMRRRDDYLAALRRFESREADVLLGTQMVAKGLDFPAVRLVGVIDADAALQLPDFRAEERGFAMLMQVLGRAGRREGPSLAIVQTAGASQAQPEVRNATSARTAEEPTSRGQVSVASRDSPERDRRVSPVLRDALDLNYPAFAACELEVRRALGEPPYMRLTRCVLSDERPGRARSEAERLVAGLRRVSGRIDAGILIDDASPCVIGRLAGRARYEVRIRTPRGVAVWRLLRAAQPDKLTPRVRRFVVDVDPAEMM